MQPDEIALSNCDKEPVHIPGRIQSFGTLIAFDVKTDLITHAASNIAEVLTHIDRSPIGRKLSEVLTDSSLIHDVRGALGLPSAVAQRERLGAWKINGHDVDVAVHVHDRTAIVELEPIREAEDRADAAIVRVRSTLANTSACSTVEDSLNVAVASLRKLTGFDRVMAYQFLPNGDGEVLAEACSPGIEPFLGLRYPAWDIPTQVREIALWMPFRVIGDVDDPHVEVLSAEHAAPLDMTRAHLRGVSPIHIEYLKNMHVGASMNCSIIVHGQLWGLLAFHHSLPKVLPPNYRSICEMFSQLFSLRLQQQLDCDSVSRAKRVQSTLASLETVDSAIFTGNFSEVAPELLKSLDADGVAFGASEAWQKFGSVPPDAALSEIATQADENICSFDSLTSSGLDAEQLGVTAGALIVPIEASDRLQLIFLRNEIITEIRWAGSREKDISYGPMGPRLHPRSSFAEYKEAVHGRCRDWTRADLAAAGELRSRLLEVMNRHLNWSERELRKQRQQQDLLIAELNHRVKNILALVRSIARQTKDSADSLEDYADSFESRIKALAFAHDLVGGRGAQQASLGELLRTELRPYELSNSRISIVGEPVALRPDAAPVMALVFHELASNAAKYGALANESGELRVTWKEDAGGVSIEWNELLQSNITPPARRGFGLTLIERAIPYECHGESDVRYRSDGVEVRMWLPQEAFARYQAPVEAPKSHVPQAKARLAKFGRVLVVEDNMILTMEMERLLTELGSEGVDSVPNIAQGLQRLAQQKYAVAILDVNLGRETSFELAEAARASGVPAMFVTGYGTDAELPDNLADVPCLSKPIDPDMLALKLSELNLGGHRT